MYEDVEVNVGVKDKVDFYLMTHQEYFPAEKMPFLRDKLLRLSEEKNELFKLRGTSKTHG